MDIWKCISEFLGIQGVFFEDIKQYKKDQRCVIQVRLFKSECFCKHCGLKLGHIKDWQEKKVQAPSLGIYTKVILKVRYPRSWCAGCLKYCAPIISWIHKKFPSLTCSFAETAGRLMEETTCRATARLLRTSAKKMWSLDEFRMQKMLQHLKLPADVDLRFLSADEVHFRTLPIERRSVLSKKYEPVFVTNLVSHKNSKVLFNSMGRGKPSLEDCFLGLSEGQKLAVESVAVDMHDAYISACREHLPNAKICVDRFHLTQGINKCFDKVRRSELKKAEDHFVQGMLSPSRRFVLIEREQSLIKSDQKMLLKLRRLNQNIHNSMLLVESFHRILDKKNLKSFKTSLMNWYQLIREAKIPAFRSFAKTIRKYRKNIEAYILTRLTTAVSEGLNNKIKTLKRMGYGYTNETSFRLKILQRCGYLNHNWISTQKWLYGD
jgi:transposase